MAAHDDAAGSAAGAHPVTVHFGERAPVITPAAYADGDALFLPHGDLESATGWHVEPQGACQGDVCIPLPPAARRDGAADLVHLARALGRPVVREGATWLVGESATDRAADLASLEAPDFELPDLVGALHRLSQYRGRKVAILSWASW